MSDSSCFDVKGYYAAKESYEKLMEEAATSSTSTDRRRGPDHRKRTPELHPALVPRFDDIGFAKAGQEEGESSTKKS